MTDKQLEWQKRLEKWHASGMSIAAWCRQEKIDSQQMYYWKKKYSQPDVEKTIDWVSLSNIPLEEGDSSLTIKLDQLIVEIQPHVDRQLLSDVIHLLRYR